MLPKVLQRDLPTVEGAGPHLLEELLGMWESELRGVGFPLESATSPGISSDEIHRIYAEADLAPPAELVTWFRWRNGQPFGAPEIGGWFAASDAASSISRRAVGFELGHGIDSWEQLTALTEIPRFCSSKFPTLGRSAA